MRKPSIYQVLAHLNSLTQFINVVIVVEFFAEAGSFDLSILDESSEIMRRIVYIRVPNRDVFNKSEAINLGYRYATSELILICDADVLLDHTFFEEIASQFKSPMGRIAICPAYVIEAADSSKRDAPGIIVVPKTFFFAIGGYCSDFQGWGLEDRDFLMRLELYGVKILKQSFGVHISHDDLERVQNYYSNSIEVMREQNRRLLAIRVQNKVTQGSLSQDINSVKEIIPNKTF